MYSGFVGLVERLENVSTKSGLLDVIKTAQYANGIVVDVVAGERVVVVDVKTVVVG